MKLTFPDHFMWGSAASATQTEGASQQFGKGKNIWDRWFELEPERFHQRVGPEHTSQFYKNMEDDIPLLTATGHNSFRTSISWSRLYPDGAGDINPQAVDFYNAMIDALLEKGITPIINLFHFDMPLAMQEIGGFENEQVAHHFARYAASCFRLFGDRVKYWFTFNEPIVHVEGGYLYNFHYPNRVDPQAAVRVAFNTLYASALAIEQYRAQDQDGKIGIVLNLTPSYPRSQHPADLRAAEIADLFFNRSFLDPAVKGTFPPELLTLLEKHNLMPSGLGQACTVIQCNTVDFLGVNYYHPRRVCARHSLPNPEAPFTPEYYFDNYTMPGSRINEDKNWEIYEKGLYDIALNIRDNYGNIPWMVSENGFGVKDERNRIVNGELNDDYRIQFYRDHLFWLHKGIAEGSHCFGYHVWTFIDNWSWSNAYRNRYGLISLDLQTGSRLVKKSGHWFKALHDNNGFDY